MNFELDDVYCNISASFCLHTVGVVSAASCQRISIDIFRSPSKKSMYANWLVVSAELQWVLRRIAVLKPHHDCMNMLPECQLCGRHVSIPINTSRRTFGV